MVIPVDPTNPFSFLNYLVSKNRIYEFLNRRVSAISRTEFNDYYRWASKQIPNIKFGEEVIGLEYNKDRFSVYTENGVYRGKNLCIGTGKSNNLNVDISSQISHSVYKYSNYQDVEFSKEEVILVVGGGQSGAEVVFDLLFRNRVSKIIWISSRNNLSPLDDTSFTNEFYSPSYRDHFMRYEGSVKKIELEKQKMSSDGISASLINNLYNILYENKYLRKEKTNVEMIFNTKVDCISGQPMMLEAKTRDIYNGQVNTIAGINKTILATGFKPVMLPFVQNFFGRLEIDPSSPPISHDMSLITQIDLPGKIFFQNSARKQHGLQDSNLALVSYRNALIINAILKKPYYKNLSETSSLISTFNNGFVKKNKPINQII